MRCALYSQTKLFANVVFVVLVPIIMQGLENYTLTGLKSIFNMARSLSFYMLEFLRWLI